MPRRGRLRVLGDYALMILLFGVLIALVSKLDRTQTRTQRGAAFISDGDSLTLDGRRVRLRGIDAPEYMQVCRNENGADYACGKLARQALVQLIAARPVSCEGRQQDRYGRLLGDCSAGDVDLNRALVLAGWAVAYGDFAAEEAAARAARRGIWAGSFERPQDWRRRHDGRQDEGRQDILAAIGDWLREFFRFR